VMLTHCINGIVFLIRIDLETIERRNVFLTVHFAIRICKWIHVILASEPSPVVMLHGYFMCSHFHHFDCQKNNRDTFCIKKRHLGWHVKYVKYANLLFEPSFESLHLHTILIQMWNLGSFIFFHTSPQYVILIFNLWERETSEMVMCLILSGARAVLGLFRSSHLHSI
jgi:hypothetical protein